MISNSDSESLMLSLKTVQHNLIMHSGVTSAGDQPPQPRDILGSIPICLKQQPNKRKVLAWNADTTIDHPNKQDTTGNGRNYVGQETIEDHLLSVC